ncbi:hypothetical protein KIH41_00950 [Litoribacter ruber]|uniref:hypothetical protein n=1 Tax=Litoribacter ruber TaxID=702568 RepID=UPI001BDA18F0|nr:hypothetical protein [Litoribacter ruber]MBT0809842.1 hypothetical protein [Litoribacter ruber]
MNYFFILPLLILGCSVSFSSQAQQSNDKKSKGSTAVKSEASPGDTLTIKSYGPNNQVKIDTLLVSGTDTLKVINGRTVGEINQKGESNKVEINHKRHPNNTSGQKVTITQTGSNNSVKINSGN